MDSAPVKRLANCKKDFLNPHFKTFWEPDRAIGRNAIKYSLVHHLYQQCISNAGLCDFCTNELTRRLIAKGLYHDDWAFMELFWQDQETDALVAAETIVDFTGDGVKIAVADHVADIARGRSVAEPRWWAERNARFQLELKAMDRYEASPSRASAWLLGVNGNPGRGDVTPWATRFAAVLWTYTRINTISIACMRDFVNMQELYLNYTHESCRAPTHYV